MSNLRDKLIKLGTTHKDLRPHLRPILEALAPQASPLKENCMPLTFSTSKEAAPTLESAVDYRKLSRVLAEVGALVGMLDALLRKLRNREHKEEASTAWKAAKQYQVVLEDVLSDQNELGIASDRLRKRHFKAMSDMIRYIKPFSYSFDSLSDEDAYDLVVGIERQFDKIEKMDTRI